MTQVHTIKNNESIEIGQMFLLCSSKNVDFINLFSA